jgi:hypothetical protein
LFFALAVLSAFLVLMELPSVRVAVLLAVLAWASARFYYFLFYVLERYVDPTLRYAGIPNLILALLRQRGAKKEAGG